MLPSPETRPTVPRPCTLRNSNRSCAVTALGLHADTVHPAGNLVFGLVFGVLENRSLLAAWHKHTLGLAAPLFFTLAWTLAFLARG